jgi:uncharacterized protein (DUF697 family)
MSYEQQQIRALAVWRGQLPVGLALSGRLAPVVSFMERMVPLPVLQAGLEGACGLGERLASPAAVLELAGVDSISALRDGGLELCDRLANRTHDRAIALAAAEGGITGAAGLVGVVLDIPGLMTLSLRTIYQIGLCYGFELSGEEGRQLVLRILGLAGANTIKDKEAALFSLAALRQVLAHQSLGPIRQAAVSAFGREATMAALRDAAMQVGLRLGRRKAANLVPVVGAALGGMINAGFVRDVGWAARRTFQSMWLEGLPLSGSGIDGPARRAPASGQFNFAFSQNTGPSAVVKAAGVE